MNSPLEELARPPTIRSADARRRLLWVKSTHYRAASIAVRFAPMSRYPPPMNRGSSFVPIVLQKSQIAVTVAASLHRRGPASLDIAIVEPSEIHYYQPCFTLVGAGRI